MWVVWALYIVYFELLVKGSFIFEFSKHKEILNGVAVEGQDMVLC